MSCAASFVGGVLELRGGRAIPATEFVARLEHGPWVWEAGGGGRVECLRQTILRLGRCVGATVRTRADGPRLWVTIGPWPWERPTGARFLRGGFPEHALAGVKDAAMLAAIVRAELDGSRAPAGGEGNGRRAP
ncbi:MAG TPA: hypothetical protein VNO79_10795 [Actinomycetota bacterium]|nr:hypothetical protein [Actinomycetota bacterium]